MSESMRCASTRRPEWLLDAVLPKLFEAYGTRGQEFNLVLSRQGGVEGQIKVVQVRLQQGNAPSETASLRPGVEKSLQIRAKLVQMDRGQAALTTQAADFGASLATKMKYRQLFKPESQRLGTCALAAQVGMRCGCSKDCRTQSF